jgi:glutaredoxin 2
MYSTTSTTEFKQSRANRAFFNEKQIKIRIFNKEVDRTQALLTLIQDC